MVAALTSLLFSFTAPANGEDCLKQVFTLYCLGGNAEVLPESVRSRALEDGRGEIRYYGDSERPVEITVRDGLIVAVARQEPDGAWLNYEEWKRKLVRLYGRGEDRSEFPRYATSRSSRLNVINAGKGKAHMRWPQDGWWVEVVWDNPDYVLLRYAVAPPREVRPPADEGL